jgi:hypothetical protein
MDSPAWFLEGGCPNTSLVCYCQANLFGQLNDIINISIVFITKSKVFQVVMSYNLIDGTKVLEEVLRVEYQDQDNDRSSAVLLH